MDGADLDNEEPFQVVCGRNCSIIRHSQHFVFEQSRTYTTKYTSTMRT